MRLFASNARTSRSATRWARAHRPAEALGVDRVPAVRPDAPEAGDRDRGARSIRPARTARAATGRVPA